MQVSIVLDSPVFMRDRLFDHRAFRDDGCYKWFFLREYLQERGIEISTFDTLDTQGIRPDKYLFLNLSPTTLLYLLRHQIGADRRILWAFETQLSHSRILRSRRFVWQFLRWFPRFFGRILTHDTSLARKPGYQQLFIPQPIPADHDELTAVEKPGFAVTISANKVSRTTGELYTCRRCVIRHFEVWRPDALDVFGIGWNEPSSRDTEFYTPLYRGPCDRKADVLSRYKFTFAIENHRHDGYINEKLFDALFVGSIPIYLGAPNVADFIPPDCFIDMSKFATLDSLCTALDDVARGEGLAALRLAGRRFLASDRYRPFSVEHFAARMHQTLVT